MNDFIPRPGALRFRDESGDWVCANPGDPLFSTVTMLATDYYKEDVGWTRIFEVDDSGDAL